jgi:hypothetical protein
MTTAEGKRQRNGGFLHPFPKITKLLCKARDLQINMLLDFGRVLERQVHR